MVAEYHLLAEVVRRRDRMGPAVGGEVLTLNEGLEHGAALGIVDSRQIAVAARGDPEPVLIAQIGPLAPGDRTGLDLETVLGNGDLAHPGRSPAEEMSGDAGGRGLGTDLPWRRLGFEPAPAGGLVQELPVGMTVHAQRVLHPPELRLVVGHLLLQPVADPTRIVHHRLDGFPDRRLDPPPLLVLAECAAEAFECFDDGRRLVGEPRQGSSGDRCRAVEPAALDGAHEVEARPVGTIRQEVAVGAKGPHCVDEGLFNWLSDVTGVAPRDQRAVRHSHRHRSDLVRELMAVELERRVRVLLHDAVAPRCFGPSLAVGVVEVELEPVEHHHGHHRARVLAGQGARDGRPHRGAGAADARANHYRATVFGEDPAVGLVMVEPPAALVVSLETEEQRPQGRRAHHPLREVELLLCRRGQEVEDRRALEALPEGAVGSLVPALVRTDGQGRHCRRAGRLWIADRPGPVVTARVGVEQSGHQLPGCLAPDRAVAGVLVYQKNVGERQRLAPLIKEAQREPEGVEPQESDRGVSSRATAEDQHVSHL